MKIEATLELVRSYVYLFILCAVKLSCGNFLSALLSLLSLLVIELYYLLSSSLLLGLHLLPLSVHHSLTTLLVQLLAI